MDVEEKEITVPVPANRVSEFYRWFADWRDGKGPALPSATARPDNQFANNVEELLPKAVRWWKLLNPTERQIWNLWLDAAPELVSDREMVEKLGLKSPNSIRGLINRFAGKGSDVGFTVGWDNPINPVTGFREYGIRDMNDPTKPAEPGLTAEEYTDLLHRARTKAES